MKKVLLIGAILALLLTGCDVGSECISENSKNIIPNISVYAKDIAYGLRYFYVVDNNTGVVYLQFNGVNRAGLTIMLNPDGTPVTAEQLGLR